MVGPERRREAVAHLRDSFPVGERRACRVIGQPRNTQRYGGKQPVKDRALTSDIHRLARAEPRAGYRGVTRLLRREGWQINEKRVHRIWKQEGLEGSLSPGPQESQWKRGKLDAAAGRGARQPSVDLRLHHDQTDDGGRLKWLPVVDEYSRELLSLEVARSITAEDVVRDLERLVRERGAPEFIRSDNGP